MTPSHVPDPPLVVYLASRLPHTGVEAATLQYLEVLGRAIADLHINVEERALLESFAHDLGLTSAHVAQAHRRFLNDLIDTAVSDNEVSDDEYEALVRVGAALHVEQSVVEQRIHPYRAAAQSIALSAGMTIVFTGEHPHLTREELTDFATQLGFEVQSGVSKSTTLVAAADPNSNSGKAGKARRYGIPIVSVERFAKARLGDVIEGHGAGQAGLKVITCPDCRTTWVVPATSGQAASKRCDECAGLTKDAARKVPQHTSPQAPSPQMMPPSTATSAAPPSAAWPPPNIQWLTCGACGQQWHRQAIRGRKPVLCPECVRRATHS